MSLVDIFYWVVFGFMVIYWLGLIAALIFGGVGYSRNSVESTPTGRDGLH